MVTIYTWGYRGRTKEDLQEVIAGLPGRVLVVDVRRRAAGARIANGWQASDVDHACRSRGASYYRASSLGNQSNTLPWVRHELAAQELLYCAGCAITTNVLLICAEVNAAGCHRSEVAEAVAEILRAAGIDAEVRHL